MKNTSARMSPLLVTNLIDMHIEKRKKAVDELKGCCGKNYKKKKK